jgi:hypothetical protein
MTITSLPTGAPYSTGLRASKERPQETLKKLAFDEDVAVLKASTYHTARG